MLHYCGQEERAQQKIDSLEAAGEHFLPDRTERDMFIANYYQIISRYETSKIYNRRVLKRLPKSFFANNNLGLFFGLQGKADSAVYFSRTAYELDSTDIASTNNYGYALFLSGEREKGQRLIERSLERNPTNHYALRNLALVFREEDPERALELMKRASYWCPPHEAVYDLIQEELAALSRQAEDE